jgi:hypothetical protein
VVGRGGTEEGGEEARALGVGGVRRGTVVEGAVVGVAAAGAVAVVGAITALSVGRAMGATTTNEEAVLTAVWRGRAAVVVAAVVRPALVPALVPALAVVAPFFGAAQGLKVGSARLLGGLNQSSPVVHRVLPVGAVAQPGKRTVGDLSGHRPCSLRRDLHNHVQFHGAAAGGSCRILALVGCLGVDNEVDDGERPLLLFVLLTVVVDVTIAVALAVVQTRVVVVVFLRVAAVVLTFVVAVVVAVPPIDPHHTATHALITRRLATHDATAHATAHALTTHHATTTATTHAAHLVHAFECTTR